MVCTLLSMFENIPEGVLFVGKKAFFTFDCHFKYVFSFKIKYHELSEI